MAKSKPKPAPRTPGKRATPDWEAVERDYRATKLTLRELGAKHGCGHTAIANKAKRQGWSRDLGEAVRQATQAKLIEQAVTTAVTNSEQNVTNAVLVTAELNKQVILRHRSDIGEARGLALDMIGELRLATHSPQELEALFREATQGLDVESLAAVQQSFKDMIRLHNRITSLHKLSDTLNKLQVLERKAFGLDDDKGGGSTGFEDLVGDLPEAQ